jgi:hypothetical protein
MDLQEPWPNLRAWSAAILKMAAIRVSRAEVEEDGAGEKGEGRRAVQYCGAKWWSESQR